MAASRDPPNDDVSTAALPAAARTRGRSLAVIDDVAARREAQTFRASQAHLDAQRPEQALPLLLSLSTPPWSPLRAAAGTIASAVLVGLGRADEAVAVGDAVVGALNDGVAIVDPAMLFTVRAHALRQVGRVDDAIAAAERAVAAEGNDGVEGRLVLAECQRASGDLRAATLTLHNAVVSAPDDVRVLGHLAAYAALGGHGPEHDDRRRFAEVARDDACWWQHAAFVAACAADDATVAAAHAAAIGHDAAGTAAFVSDAPEIQVALARHRA